MQILVQWQPSSSSLTQWVRMPKLDIYSYHLWWVITSGLTFDLSRLHICHELEAFSICYVCQWDSVGAVCQGLCSRHFAYVLSSSQHPARCVSNIKGEAMMALAKVTAHGGIWAQICGPQSLCSQAPHLYASELQIRISPLNYKAGTTS